MAVRYALTRLRLYRQITQTSENGYLVTSGCDTYCLTTTGIFNSSLRPAVVMVRDGSTNLIKHQETVEDLTRGNVL